MAFWVNAPMDNILGGQRSFSSTGISSTASSRRVDYTQATRALLKFKEDGTSRLGRAWKISLSPVL
jgi:hypothetical protein